MSEMYADVVRVHDSKANFTGERIIRKQWGFAEDSEEIMVRKADGTYVPVGGDKWEFESLP